MAKSKYHVGLEIGTSSTRVVVAEVKPDLSVKILGLGQSKSAGVKKGEIYNISQARSVIRATILEAEQASEIQIASVFLAVTGGHIKGVNNRGYLTLESETEIAEQDVIDVEDAASDIKIPDDHAYIHTLARHYRLDGQDFRISPAGMIGKNLEAELHLIHGKKSRVQSAMKVTLETTEVIEDLVFAPIASAQIGVSREQKEAGALVVDIGGGTTDYALYINGSVYCSGCIPIGGEHITNDIHLAAKIPPANAEKLKIEFGDVSDEQRDRPGVVPVMDIFGLDVADLEYKRLNFVMRSRLEELFRVLHKSLPNGILKHIGAGVFLRGGVSKTKGIVDVVNRVFALPVHLPGSGVNTSNKYADDPELYTVLGLIYYAQILDEEEPPESKTPLGFLKSLFG